MDAFAIPFLRFGIDTMAKKFFSSPWVLLFFLLLASCASSKHITPYSGALANADTTCPIVLIGDTQRTSFWEFWRENNTPFRKAILRKVASLQPAFVLHVGDLVFQGASTGHWEEFDDNASSIREQGIPVFPVLGNHEYYGDNSEALSQYFSRFPALHNRQWYSFRFRSIAFVLLNSNFDELNEEEIREQNDWYAQTMRQQQADSAVSTIVVVCHHPPYSNSTVVGDNPDVQQHFVPLFNTTPKARLLVSGHCHSYEHFIKGEKHFLITGGGGGPRQEVELNPEQQRHTDSYIGAAIRPLHFCTVELRNTTLQIQMLQLHQDTGTWSVGDMFVIPTTQ